MCKLLVGGELIPGPPETRARNPVEDGTLRFASKGMRAQVTELIVHETVTCSVADTLSVLQARGLSVHLILGADGVLSQHGDLLSDLLWHAGPVHNPPSIGIEVVNPYYPRFLPRRGPWSTTIEARWAHQGRYVVPTAPQAEALAQLVGWITSGPAPGVDVPRSWPGLRDGKMTMGRLPSAEQPLPGLLAHTFFGHADGAWLVLYAWLRLEAGLEATDAYREAIERATGAHLEVDLSDLIVQAMAPLNT